MLGEPAEGAPSRQDVANLDLIEISDGLGSSWKSGPHSPNRG